MESNAIAEAIRYKIITNLRQRGIESDELSCLIDEIGAIVVNINKIFIGEMKKLQLQIEELEGTVDYLENRVYDYQDKEHTEVVNNINITLDKANLRRLFE